MVNAHGHCVCARRRKGKINWRSLTHLVGVYIHLLAFELCKLAVQYQISKFYKIQAEVDARPTVLN